MTRALLLPLLWCCMGIGVAVWTIPAWGQDMTCDHYPALVERLTGEFGEMPVVRGLNWSGQIAEWWANLETGTWSLVTLRPDGYACIPAHGSGHEVAAAPAIGIDG